MKRIIQLSPTVRWLLPLVVLGLVISYLPSTTTIATTTREFTITAFQFEFTPGRLEVNKGDTVVIRLAASDVTHGFYLDGYGLEQRVEPGISQKISFIADQAGKFRYRCSVSCGALHPFMIGELVVNTNLPFWQSLGLLTGGVVGTLVYLWQFGRNEQ
ncbi:MAG: cupredoxin domain-containing protein [Anaerolineae bacterium]|nr:cupredoxin domain-containing protein [Anaerolineae bacterium]